MFVLSMPLSRNAAAFRDHIQLCVLSETPHAPPSFTVKAVDARLWQLRCTQWAGLHPSLGSEQRDLSHHWQPEPTCT